jgi:hypothetical protein
MRYERQEGSSTVRTEYEGGSNYFINYKILLVMERSE